MQTDWRQEAVAQQRKMEEAAAADRARVANAQRLMQMWLSLGPDVLIAAGSQHRPEIDEALGLATWRWSRLHDLESQCLREEQILATRGKKRPPAHDEELLPDRTVAQRDAAYLDETKHRKAALGDLKAEAKKERAELESYVVKSKAR
jgi:hypothetical protein